MAIERLNLASAYNPVEASIHIGRYSTAQSFVAGKAVLDIGCGEGYGARLLEIWGAKKVVAVDISGESIAAARARYASDRVSFVQADVLDLNASVEGPFDVIVCFENIEHVKDPTRLLENIKAVSHPGTVSLISCPNDYYYYGQGRSLNSHHLAEYSWSDFRGLSEGILGEADWLFGTTLAGFASLPAGSGSEPEDYAKMSDELTSLRMNLVPNVAQSTRLTPSRSLYYIGIWPKQSTKPTGTAAGFPAHVDYRLPTFSLVSPSVRAGYCRKIAFVLDGKTQAHADILKGITPHFGQRYRAARFCPEDYEGNDVALLHDVFVKNDHDNIHFLDRESLFRALSDNAKLRDLLRISGLPPSKLARRLARPVLTSSVHDQRFLGEKEFDQRRPSLTLLDGYSVSSSTLNCLYTRSDVPPPLCLTEDGVDLTFFGRTKRERLMTSGRPLVIGWNGGQSDLRDGQKGSLRNVVQAIQLLQSEGLEVVGHFADQPVMERSASERRDYYHEIDLLLCTSELEGTPNPVLEAMACGVPIIASPAGVVMDALGPKQSEFLLTEPSSEGLARLLRRLIKDQPLLEELSKESLERIQSWNWSSKVPSWLTLFSFAELRHDSLLHLREMMFRKLLETAVELDGVAKSSTLDAQPRPIRAVAVPVAARPSREARVPASEVENKALLAKLEVLIGHQKRIADGVQQIARAQQRQASRPSLSRRVLNRLGWR